MDVLNHGTVVAGIIALNGPVNVKIINLKVTILNKISQNSKKEKEKQFVRNDFIK